MPMVSCGSAQKKGHTKINIKFCIKVPVELCIIQPALQLQMRYHAAITGGHPTTDNGSHLFLFVQTRDAADTGFVRGARTKLKRCQSGLMKLHHANVSTTIVD